MPRKPKTPEAPETVDEVDLSPRQEQLVAKLTDPEADPVVKYLKADREPDETVAAWLARRWCYDLETERQALRQIDDIGERHKASQHMWSVAQTRKAQMEIISRASELEQAKTADATTAAAFRAMMERYPKTEVAEKMAGKTRSERHAEWKTSRVVARS